MIRQEIEKLLAEATGEKVELTPTKNPAHGDFSTNIAMQQAKKLGKNPRTVAEEIIKALPQNDLIAKTEIAGAGFINFFLKTEKIAEEIVKFDPEKKIDLLNGKKIVLDFSHPNIAKPLHFGHFRSTVIGEALARILAHAGADLLRDNYLGDWGTQFGKLIVAIRKWGDEEVIKKDPIAELVKLYQRFHKEAEAHPELEKEGAEEFRKMEQERDEENFRLWKWIVQVSLEQVQKFYDRIDAHFDVIRGESHWESHLKATLELMTKKGVIQESEGALVAFFSEESKLPPMLYRRSDGASLYQTRDIARILYYNQEGAEELVYVVGADQGLHFRQLAETAKMLGLKTKITHVNFGLVRLKEGKLSTREGRTIDLNAVLDEAEERAEKILQERQIDFPPAEMEKLKKTIAMGAIKFNDLSQNRTGDIVFDWDKMLSFEGYSAPFLQYSYARGQNILRKADDFSAPNELVLREDAEIALAKKILAFPEAAALTVANLKPNFLAEYLFELAGEFNRFYATVPVLNAPAEERAVRLFLTEKTGKTLKKGLSLLGIEVPERM